ncbi:MAG: ABC-F family ATP-binding cassette domain-containing protein, partial [Pyrinomonadaceae bacterium]|nr:ABC-F family ATP-binding cassette domain-containing protein [Pyrinomonadaceae bacterium]
DQAYVIVSHDRYFLDKTCTKIVEIENGKAYTYQGNYSKYVVESALQKEQRQREYENQQAYIKKTEAFVRKNLAGQKTKQAKSRRNMLERMDRLESAGKNDRSGNFDLKHVERTGANVLSVEKLSIGFPGLTLAEDIDFLLHRGECLGVIGGNGTGKTTFLKTILGEIRELSGNMLWGTKVNIGYYSQQLEELEFSNDLIAEMRRIDPLAETGDLRSFLAQFLFFGEDVFKQVGDLSGGEKGRLSLAKLIYSRANVLILDEPTNHLDIPSREALEKALSEYDGTIITVSHDRYFLDQIATQIFAFEENGRFEIYNGNYSQYHEWKEGLNETGKLEIEDGPKILSESVGQQGKSANAKVKIAGSGELSKNEQKKVRSRVEKLEEEIAEKEELLKTLAQRMSDPDTIAEKDKYLEINQEYQNTESSIQHLYAEWEQLSEKLA